ncbi:MAG: ABC transporter permease [Oscillibacter sp.]|nr:ABC transporter permease [Oscillibacter sp.]MDY5017765.1 ABC transporter permease [Oscillospiraceae bacterium]
MIRYILKRVVAALITIWFIMTLTFVLMYAIPGSPISTEKVYDVALQQALEEKFGLNKPLHERYVKCLVDYAHGDFGISYLKIGLTTNEIIASGFPYSLRIGIYATGLIVLFGIAAGILAALRQNRFVDHFLMVLSTLGSTIPSFVFATLYLFLFSKILGLVPAFGVKPWTGYIGPVLVTSVFSMAFVTRLMRTSMIEELNQDYIRTARAKGISEFKVVAKHAMRNAILPVVTYVGPMIAMVVTGSFVIEKVFGIPGIGSLFTSSVLTRDYTLIMGITVFFSVFLVFCTLVVDILYVFVDPRIKYE